MHPGISRFKQTLTRIVWELKGTYFFSFLAISVVLLVISSWGIYYFELKKSAGNFGYLDSLWWALVTVTTVGYGDIVPKTTAGRLIGFGIMISGIFLFSLMTASIASVFVSRKIKEDKGLEDVSDKDHLVICGWNKSGPSLIRSLMLQFKPKIPVMVLVNDLHKAEVEQIVSEFKEIKIRYVRGNFTKENILVKANITRARAAIIVADRSSQADAGKVDERTIFGCLAIKSLAPKVKTCAELIDGENAEHLKRARVDEIVVRGEFNAAVLAGAATGKGLSTVMKRIFDADEPNKLWLARIPERFVSRTTGELAEHFQTRYQAILMAVATESAPMRLQDILSPDSSVIDNFIRRKFEESGKDFFTASRERISVQINPPHDYVLTKHDSAIVLGRKRPAESTLLERGLDLVTGGGRTEGR